MIVYELELWLMFPHILHIQLQVLTNRDWNHLKIPSFVAWTIEIRKENIWLRCH
jgi:hypothetical protein